jgi:hypothetical protein
MADDFDAARYRVATDPMVSEGFEDVADWVRRQIAREERRLKLRESAGRSILAETIRLAEISGPIQVPRDGSMIEAHLTIQAHPMIHSLRHWLGGNGRLLRGLAVQIITAPPGSERNSFGLEMRVVVAGWTFSRSGVWRPRSSPAHEAEAFKRCHDELIGYLGPGVEIL